MKPVLKLRFDGLFPRCEQFFRWFFNHYVELDETSAPDFVMVGDFGEAFETPTNARTIYYTGENIRPDFNRFDYAITFDRLEDPRHYRLPLYVLEYYARWAEFKVISDWNFLIHPRPDPKTILQSKNGFCNFIVSNPHGSFRDDFFRALSAYKPVDSAGSHLNTMNWSLPKEPEVFFSEKIKFQKNYKFSLAFENSSYPGYLTEKILDPFLAHSIPIYWGDPLVHLDFNPRAFINAASFKTVDDLIAWIVKVDQHDDLFYEYMASPPLHSNKMKGPWDLNALWDFFQSLSRAS